MGVWESDWNHWIYRTRERSTKYYGTSFELHFRLKVLSHFGLSPTARIARSEPRSMVRFAFVFRLDPTRSYPPK